MVRVQRFLSSALDLVRSCPTAHQYNYQRLWRSTKVYLKVSNSRWNEVTVAGKIERPKDISTGVVPGVVAKIDPNAIN